MAKGIPFLKDAPYNVLTVPNYVRNLVVTTAPGTIKAQYNPPDDPEATECWTTYKAGSYPEHPFDGKRVVTPLEAPGVVDRKYPPASAHERHGRQQSHAKGGFQPGRGDV